MDLLEFAEKNDRTQNDKKFHRCLLVMMEIPDLSALLETQFSHIEDYCNSQTNLYNATVSGNHVDTVRVIAEWSKSIALVRNDLEQFERNFPYLSHHNNLTRRVIQTISQNPSVDTIGIPGRVNIKANTVALATLRASIKQVLAPNM